MFDEFADSEDLARRAELLLNCVEGLDGGLRAVCAVQVPCVKAGEVLDCSEEFVAADCDLISWVSGFGFRVCSSAGGGWVVLLGQGV